MESEGCEGRGWGPEDDVPGLALVGLAVPRMGWAPMPGQPNFLRPLR